MLGKPRDQNTDKSRAESDAKASAVTDCFLIMFCIVHESDFNTLPGFRTDLKQRLRARSVRVFFSGLFLPKEFLQSLFFIQFRLLQHLPEQEGKLLSELRTGLHAQGDQVPPCERQLF